MQNTFDTGPLSWVMAEVREALSLAKNQLQGVVEKNVESRSTMLMHAKIYLHQVNGALHMVDVDGIGKLVDAVETLLGHLEEGKIAVDDAAVTAIVDALDAVPGYLDELLVSGVQKPVTLFPYYRNVLRIDSDKPASPVDLFFPDVTSAIAVPLIIDASTTYSPDQKSVEKDLSVIRKNFERALLPLLKQTDAELLRANSKQMQDLIAEIWLADANSNARAFWAVMHAYIELVSHQNMLTEQSVRQFFGRINMQIRRLVEGAASIPESLLREALFVIARAKNLSPNASKVFDAYQLSGQVPADFDVQTLGKIDFGAVASGLERLAAIKTLWGKIAAGDQTLSDKFEQKMGELAEVGLKLHSPPLSKFLRELMGLTRHVIKGKLNEAFALEMATSLLFIESALDQIAHLPREFAERADMLSARLLSLVSGESPDDGAPWLDEMSKKAQERQTMRVLVEEMQASMHIVEKNLDDYFRASSVAADLTGIDSIMHQVAGALAILDQDDASLALIHTQELIRGMVQAEDSVDTAVHSQIAQNIGALSFLIEALQTQTPESVKAKFSFDKTTGYFKSHFLDNLAPAQPVKSAPVVDVAPLVAQSTEQELLERQKQSEDLASSLMAEPHNETIKTQLLDNLEQERTAARLIDDVEVSERAAAAIDVIAHTDFDAALPQIDKIIDTVAEVLEEPVEPEMPPQLPSPMSDAAVDAELLEVFLMEAEEVVASINETIPLSRTDPRFQDHLITLRRAFHTLKGSSRMVGLNAFGDAGWSIEQVMNSWLADAKSGTEDLYTLLEKAAAVFGAWVADLNAMGTSDYDGLALTAAADRVRHGQAYLYQDVVIESDPVVEIVVEPIAEPIVEPIVEAIVEPIVEPIVEAVAVPEHNVIEFPSNATYLPEEDVSKKIGNIEIALPLFNIYLAETDEIVRFLSQDFSEWRHEPARPITTHAVHAAHSLAGTSATVGFVALKDVARALEMLLLRLESDPVVLSTDEFDTLENCVDCFKGMLQQFAVAELAPPQPTQIAALDRLLATLIERARAEIVQPEMEEPSEEELAPIKEDIDLDLLPVFLEEGSDLFPLIGQTLRAWQAAPGDAEVAKSLLRLLHTVKGSARMAGAMHLGQKTHDMETEIEEFMQAGAPTSGDLDKLLALHDTNIALFEHLKNPAAPVVLPTALVEEKKEVQQTTAVAATNLVRVRADILDRLVNQAGEVSISRSRLENEVTTLRSSMQELSENVNRLRDQLREIEIQAETQISSRMSSQGDLGFDPLEFDRFTRLQELTRMMAESVNDVHTVQGNISKTVEGAAGDLLSQARLTRELQQDLMRVRMVPFASISERLFRITRQTSKELDKRVNLDIRGASVEIDRGVLEKMAGPFEHLLRNAMVHGIESREQRLASNKNEVGEILVSIRQEGNEVVINFTDDGQGLDLHRIREKAIHAGLLPADQEVSDAEAVNLIFESGFSTAHEVTELAGRGVGMDVVRAEASALGGRVSVASTRGMGSNFTIHLPLTLAVTQVVLLSCGGTTYAIPSVLVEQVQQLKEAALASAYQDGAIMWHGQRVAMHYLATVLGDLKSVPVGQQYAPVIVLRAGEERVALHVDEVIGNREVVVKNIGPQLARMIGISGATVLGSGEIVLIVDPLPLAQKMEMDLLRAPRDAQARSLNKLEAKLQETLQEKSQEPVSSTPVQGMRRYHIVMVVDDSITVRKVTQRFLQREGFQVVLAKDGVDALEQLQSITPDVMLVDIEMPRMDGFDLTRNVRSDERLSHIPIIMITSRTADKHRSYATELGVSAYFGKPFQEDALLEAITGFLVVKN